MSDAYDSTADTVKHILRVNELIGQIVRELTLRGVNHDRTKLEEPEKETFDRVTPQLKGSTYGSEEYKNGLLDMKEALAHHYANNRHHPEHFDNGINGMTLIDLMEMLADWKAATERHDDGDLGESLGIQQRRFGMSTQLTEIFANTAKELGWMQK